MLTQCLKLRILRGGHEVPDENLPVKVPASASLPLRNSDMLKAEMSNIEAEVKF